MTIFDALVVRNIPPGMNDREFSPPYNLCGSKYRLVNVGLGVPVSRNQKHVSTNVDMRFVHTEGCPSPGVATPHVNIAEI